MKKSRTILLAILLLIILFVIFLPRLASFSFGKNFLIRSFSQGKEASIQSLSLRWFGPQKMEGVKYEGEEMNVAFDSLETDLSLWTLLSLKKHPQKILSLKGSFDLQNAHIALHSPEAVFSELNAKASLLPKENTLSFTVQSNLSIPDAEKGTLSLKGAIKDLSHPDLANVSCDVEARVQNFPSYALKRIFPSAKKLPVLLGETVNIDSDIHLEKGIGPIAITVNGASFKAALDGLWQKDHLLLQKPFVSSFMLTESISKSLLADVSPFFLTGVQAKNPIRLRIEPEGFQASYPFEKENIAIGKGTLDMGKILCQNGGSLNMAISLMKLHTLSGVNEMEVWFTPVDFSLKEGILQSGRIDFLVADSLHFCSWGKVDLNQDKLRMVLGITAQAVQKAFGIRGLPENYVMQIPIRGSRGHPEINLGKAGAKIAALLAAQAAGKKIPFGDLLGGVVGAATESEAPPPKKPFPWERKN